MATEKRGEKRRHLLCYLRVFDRAREELLGRVADITTEGMMLVSDEPVPTGARYRLWMEYPLEDADMGRILLEAESLWCRRAENPELHECGFAFVDLEPETARDIRRLIDELDFEDCDTGA